MTLHFLQIRRHVAGHLTGIECVQTVRIAPLAFDPPAATTHPSRRSNHRSQTRGQGSVALTKRFSSQCYAEASQQHMIFSRFDRRT